VRAAGVVEGIVEVDVVGIVDLAVLGIAAAESIAPAPAVGTVPEERAVADRGIAVCMYCEAERSRTLHPSQCDTYQCNISTHEVDLVLGRRGLATPHTASWREESSRSYVPARLEYGQKCSQLCLTECSPF